jgi:hypothetical protein
VQLRTRGQNGGRAHFGLARAGRAGGQAAFQRALLATSTPATCQKNGESMHNGQKLGRSSQATPGQSEQVLVTNTCWIYSDKQSAARGGGRLQRHYPEAIVAV